MSAEPSTPAVDRDLHSRMDCWVVACLGAVLVARRQRDQRNRCWASRAGLVRVASRWAILLRVSGICPGGAGWRACSVAVAMVRKAAASGQGGPPVPGGPAADLMLVQAGQALGGLELSSTVQRRPAVFTRVASGTRCGA